MVLELHVLQTYFSHQMTILLLYIQNILRRVTISIEFQDGYGIYKSSGCY